MTLLLLLLTTLGLAQDTCAELVTVPEHGETDVPPSLSAIRVGPPKALGYSSSPAPCIPDVVTLVDEERGEPLTEEPLEGPSDGDYFLLPPLAPDTTYVLTLERPAAEPTVVTFRTGAARPDPTVPVPELIDSRAWRAGETVCSEAVAIVRDAGPWAIISSNVGRPPPWVRGTDGEQTVRLSTADAHHSIKIWTGGCGGSPENLTTVRVMVDSLITLEHQEAVSVTDVERVRDASLCPAPPERYPRPPEECSAVGGGGSWLGLVGALLVALLRRRRAT